MTLPNFLIIGAPRSGTTFLFEGLRTHPDVYMSPIKEPLFFALEGDGIRFQGPGDNKPGRAGIRTYSEYIDLYKGVSDENVIGEASTLYLSSVIAARNIHDRVPDAKLIAILRNPVERAFSSYIQHRMQGRETSSFQQAIEMEEERLANNWSPFWGYTSMGFYGKQLSNYLEIFQQDQILVLLHDDLRVNIQTIYSTIFGFLEINPDFSPELTQKQNPSGIPKSALLQRLIDILVKSNLTDKYLKPLLPKRLRRRIRLDVVGRLQNQNLVKPEIDPITKNYLLDLFRQDIELTETLILRDLSHWLVSD